MVYVLAGISVVETFADMNASSFAMVTMSRTTGILWRVTGSAVRSAAAIKGSAEFLAPAIRTVP
jgi:hypothetical protein